MCIIKLMLSSTVLVSFKLHCESTVHEVSALAIHKLQLNKNKQTVEQR